MNVFKRVYCRCYQAVFRHLIPILPYREPTIFHSVDELPDLLIKKGHLSVLLVTDESLRKFGVTSHLEEILKENGIDCIVYDKTCPNPTIKNVEEALEMYIENDCKALIAFGGGSSIDCAKGVGARVAYPKKSVNKLKGTLKVRRRIPPLIAIPTTAGTGSEVTIAAVITDSETKHKYAMNSFPLIPSYAVLDPKVTFTLPKGLTATTGMDALTHAVEAYIGQSTTRETRKKALEAVSLIYANIKKAYDDGHDYDARSNMLKASYLAGVAFTKSYVGYIHAIAHSLGGQYNIAHGLANAVIMPYVLDAYGKSAYKKLYKLGKAAGIVDNQDSIEIGAKKFVQSIRDLNECMNIPTTLPGIKKEDIRMMANHADKEANPLYPVPKLMDRSELEKIYFSISENE